MKTKPSFDYESQVSAPVIGVDEAGCGAWAGPVVAAAAWIDPLTAPQEILQEINDSKKLLKEKRESLFTLFLKASWIETAVGVAEVQEIDALNIGRATCLAMERAVSKLSLTIPFKTALVDGIRRPFLSCPTVLVKKGDQKSFSIAAASIAAKVTRDTLMQELDQAFPAYGWAHNVGYGTKHHQNSLAHFGISPHHRRSYAPIAHYLQKTIPQGTLFEDNPLYP